MSLTSRPAVPADYALFARLSAELNTGDPTPERGVWEASQMPAIRFHEDGGEVVAYTWVTPLADTGYVRHLVVDPAHRGRGYGRLVMEAARRALREAGCARWMLNVKPDNTPAVKLYESLGMRPRYESTALRFAWDVVETLPEPGRAVAARLAEPAEDAALDEAFGLAKGTLAGTRAGPDRVVVRLVDPADPGEARVGVAAFNPHFPGAFPFKVAEPALARPLLEATRPYALPRFAHVGVVVEDDAPLARMLVEHGAEVRLEIVHYEGEL